MKKLCWNITISVFLLFSVIYAQKLNFEKKKVGILVSKKNLKIDGYQAKYWASYLQMNDTIGLTEENLKTAVTIKLGQLIAQWFHQYLKTSEVYFLNEGKKFEAIVKSYPFQEKPQLPLPLDYVLCIDTINLYSIKEKIVLSFSNKLFTEYQTKMYIEGNLSVYQIEPFQTFYFNYQKVSENVLLSNPIKIEELNYKIEKLFATWVNHFL